MATVPRDHGFPIQTIVVDDVEEDCIDDCIDVDIAFAVVVAAAAAAAFVVDVLRLVASILYSANGVSTVSK